jgi:hypothetical protein
MPTTIGQHTVATFTSPVNGTTPIDANTVRGNDNTIRTSYNNHDSDPGIHVQSSTLASRPVAGTAGRKWITEDSGVYTLWVDDGTNWHPVSGEAVALSVYATQTLVRGDVVKVTGWNNGQDLPEVAKVASATDVAFAVMTAATASGAMGYATNTGILQDVATNTFSVGDILYPNTSGSFTATKPTSGNYQPCGFVLRSNVNNGVLYVEFSAPRIVERSDNTASTVVLRDASGNFSAGTITATLSGSITGNAATATALQTARNINGVSFNGTADITVTAAAGTLTGTTLASNVVSSSLTSVGTLTNLTVTNTITGSVSGSSGSTTGNAATATALQTARTINGVSFNGTADITVTAAAGTLSGSTLASGVTASSLTSVGTLTSLTVSGNGVFGPENGRSVDTSYIRVYGGTIATGGANLLVFGDSHPSAPGRLSLSASGTGHVEINTGGLQRFLLDASGNLAVDTNTLFVDAVNNRVGVLTSSPSHALQVNGTALVGSIEILETSAFLSNSGSALIGWANNFAGYGNGTLILQPRSSAASPIVFATGSTTATEKMRLDASGNLGLGVTPSAWGVGKAIEVGAAGNAIWGVQAADMRFLVNAYYDGTNYRYNHNATAGRYECGATHAWYTAASGTAGNVISFVQAMTLDASGNLGLGVAPSAWSSGNTAMQIGNGGVTLLGTTGGAMLGANFYFDGSYRYVVSAAASRYAQSSGEHAWFTAASGTAGNAISFTQAMTLDSSGNLGLGATPSAWAASSRTIDIGSFTCVGQNTAGAAILAFNAFQNSAGTWTYKTNNPAARHETGVNGTAAHAWYTAPSGTAGNAVTFTERMRVDATATAGETALLLWDVDNGTLERVTVGAADSGGVGFKVLRIPN